MKIGNFELGDKAVILAPMEDVTDVVFRKICRREGADLAYSEFVSAEALIRKAEKSFRKIEKTDLDTPFVVQIFGGDPSVMAEAAKILEQEGVDIVDINFGCPVKKIVSKGGGSALLKDPDRLIKIAEAVANAVSIPVTAKTRIGWDYNNIIIEDLAPRLQDAGIQAIALHARTRSQMYSGTADWTFFGKLKQNGNLNIPLIANGDISSGEVAEKVFNDFGVDAVMVGRAAIGNPWIFREIKHYLTKKSHREPPTIDERVAICSEHLMAYEGLKNERLAVLEMRKNYSGYFKGISNFKPFKIKLMEAQNKDEVINVLQEIKRELI